MFNVPENIEVKEFFERVVPETIGPLLRDNPVKGMEGTEFRLQFNITGEGGGIYSIKVKDGKEMEVVSGGISEPHIEIEISEKNWREAITGKVEGVMDIFFSPQRASRNQFEALKNIKGVMIAEFDRDYESPFFVKLKFNNAEAPQVKFKLRLSDYIAIIKGQLDRVNAFMMGKIRIEGDMGFAMKLNQLMTT